MKQRCFNQKHRDYKNYGARGITVCNAWLGANGFLTFASDIGERPTPKHTIDRIDNNGDYAPDNVRWATRAEQNRNSRNNNPISFVYWWKTRHCYRVVFRGKHLGLFKYYNDAAKYVSDNIRIA